MDSLTGFAPRRRTWIWIAPDGNRRRPRGKVSDLSNSLADRGMTRLSRWLRGILSVHELCTKIQCLARYGANAAANSLIFGGWGEIRTHGTLAGTPVFKTGALNHS